VVGMVVLRLVSRYLERYGGQLSYLRPPPLSFMIYVSGGIILGEGFVSVAIKWG